MHIQRLLNGNILIWLFSDRGLDNILILNGGDILFLKTVHTIHLRNPETIEDLKSLRPREFMEKYFPDESISFDSELYWFIRNKVEKKEIPVWSSDRKLEDDIEECLSKCRKEIIQILTNY